MQLRPTAKTRPCWLPAQLTPAGVATYKFRPGPGSHSYQAVFVGTNSYAKSTSTTLGLTVGLLAKLSTTTAIASSGSVGDYTLTAMVTSVGSATLFPTGQVSFLDTTNGTALLGKGALVEGAWTESFATSPLANPNLGSNPIAVGDFNGDGILDVAVLNNNDPGILTVLLGNGDGTFSTKFSLSVGIFSGFITVGDFNGDGVPDLLIPNCCGYPLTVLLGNGDGTFSAKTPSLAVSGYIVVADFNGDGIQDLAVAGDGLTVLLGNGDGTFTTKSSPPVGNGADAVVVADFNADGIPDLATANYYDGTVTVLLGNGDGTFTAKSAPSAGYYPRWITAADFNGDGIPDLAVANSVGSTIHVLLGNGDGTFNAVFDSAVGSTPETILVGDFNGDGIPDLATGNYFGDSISILLGNGDGTFTAEPSPVLGYQPVASSFAIGDFDGNGTLDMVTSEMVLLNASTETATATVNGVSVQGGSIHQVDASYAGDSNYISSASATTPLLAAKMSTSLVLTSNTRSLLSRSSNHPLCEADCHTTLGDLTSDGRDRNLLRMAALSSPPVHFPQA